MATAIAAAAVLLGLTQADGLSVLVFSKTAGFRHDSIPEGIQAIKDLGRRNHFQVTATEDASAFDSPSLAKYNVVVFLNTTGDVLGDEQQKAFEQFVEKGGGFVGVHAASDTEYEWPWYGRCMGAYFQSHPAIQEATIKVEDRKHPSSSFLPTVWKFTDEWYDYKSNPRASVRVLASLDESTYQGGKMGDHPVMWCREVGKGRSWYTNLGHRKETYQDDLFLRSLKEGILWAARDDKPAKVRDPFRRDDRENWADLVR